VRGKAGREVEGPPWGEGGGGVEGEEEGKEELAPC